MAAIHRTEKLTNVEIGNWTEDGTSKLQVRVITYTKPLKIPLPMAPKSAKVIETQTVLYKADGSWAAEIRCQTTAPKGDCFYVLCQYVATADGDQRCRVKSSMQVEFLLSVGFLKSTIVGGSEKDTRRFQGVLFAAYHAHAASLDRPASQRLASSTLDAASVQPAQQALVAKPSAGVEKGGFRAECFTLVFRLLVLLALVTLCLVVCGASVRIGEAVADLAEAVRAHGKGSCSSDPGASFSLSLD
ncbi:MAG: hypothetical protein WDW36_004875 [Sanguina aurantia]